MAKITGHEPALSASAGLSGNEPELGGAFAIALLAEHIVETITSPFRGVDWDIATEQKCTEYEQRRKETIFQYIDIGLIADSLGMTNREFFHHFALAEALNVRDAELIGISFEEARQRYRELLNSGVRQRPLEIWSRAVFEQLIFISRYTIVDGDD